ncbi:hypothetical protein [Roseibacillus persicicus]|uniref:Uncharacterized protein n=1 Tax=Roseibacillus persicicus TaxID=454148 RepID=A0A918TL90_9BACT|nr:hypothetical protein [Roseibacillus persicicus]GHC49997.1 hypothetical protein GCM10007100_15010 [Roseibacillus persicicus]
MTIPTQDLRKNLQFWSLHCSITALPSFLMAGVFLELFQSVFSVLAMLTGVLIFILGYSLVSTFVPTLNNRNSLFSRALAIALKLRIAVTVLGLLALCLPILFLLHPDYYAGLFAKALLESAYSLVSQSSYYDLAQSNDFFAILLWTLTEGVILSFLLIFVSFFCLILVNRRQNRVLPFTTSQPSNNPSSEQSP